MRAAVPGGVDLLLDGAGGQTRDQALGAVRDGGRAIFPVLQSTPAQLERGITGESFAAHADRPRLEQLGRLVDAGQLRPRTGRCCRSSRLAKRWRASRAGGTVRTGSVLQARYEPGAPGCLPGFRLPPPCCGSPAGGVRPGWSSSDGGSEELPEFRDAARSSLASRSSSSPTRPASAAFCAASMAMSWPCSAISASRETSSGLAVTDHHHPGSAFVIKPARWAGQKTSLAATRYALT